MSAGRTPDVLVERLRAGDLPPEEAARVRARLEAEGGLGRLEALARDDAAFLAAHPPGPALGEIRRRAGLAAPPRRRSGRLVWLPALAAAAAAAVVALRAPVAPAVREDGLEDTRAKGDPRLELHRRRGAGAPEALRSGAAARGGDLLQVSYVAAGAAYGAVVSVDGRGAVTLHLPERTGPAARLQGGGAIPLAHAYLLDDAPRFERFFLVTSAEPFDAGVVADAARRLADAGRAATDPLPLPAGLAQRDLLLVKERP